jgi:hypothetical protein
MKLFVVFLYILSFSPFLDTNILLARYLDRPK